MLLDGISIKGSYHEINQDCFQVKKLDKGFAVAVSDGLGSRSHSQYGSAAVCSSVIEIATQKEEDLLEIDKDILLKEIYDRWLTKLKEYDIRNCYATMLWVICYSGRLMAARLGDGFIGICADSETVVLFDRKEDFFINETECLTEEMDFSKVDYIELEVSELKGGVVCTDGFCIGEMKQEELIGFSEGFVEGYSDMKQNEILEDIKRWFLTWPGADDKTMAYFIAERN
jgi:hypothetical protein